MDPKEQWWTSGGSEESVWPRVGAHAAASARVAAHLLGGKDHFRADRVAAELLREAAPSWASTARAARLSVLNLAGRLAAQGVGQVVDLGCGLTTGHHEKSPHALLPLHTAVLPAAPGTRIVYADRDPMVMTHARALLRSPVPDAVQHLEVDLCEPDELLAALRGGQVRLDLAAPVAVVLSDVLHELEDRQVARLLGALHTALAPGSVVVLSHRTPHVDEAQRAAVAAVHAEVGLAWNPRTPAQITELAYPWALMVPAVHPPEFAVALLTNRREGR
ncbi:SAM-dependent methyltransferase [Kitasatospora sp. NPDC057542]|uniref:SAM-dependent methyltransferase n=1 Tax=Kitasatospora sp. NPDC057542 TaxID=3346162 RepID=UPI0036A67B49